MTEPLVERYEADAIIQMVLAYYKVRKDDLRGDRRSRGVVQARHMAAYILRHHTALSYPEIGRLLWKDHTTVLHAVAKIDGVVEAMPRGETARAYRVLRARLRKTDDPKAPTPGELQRALRELVEAVETAPHDDHLTDPLLISAVREARVLLRRTGERKSPELPDRWEWKPTKDAGYGYLVSPTGHTTRNPVTVKRAEVLAQSWDPQLPRAEEGDHEHG